MIEQTVLLVAGAEPVKVPATRRLIVIKPSGAAPTVEAEGDMEAIHADEMTLGGVLAALDQAGVRQLITRVACMDEQYVLLAAKIREALGLPGQSFMSARAFRNKLFMKEYLRTAGTFKLPAFWSPLQRRAQEEVFSPDGIVSIVRKPLLGSGGIEVRIFPDIASVDAVAQDEMLEAFIDLPMLHVDGLVVDGEVSFFAVSRYLNFCLSFTEFTYVGSEFSHDAALNRRVEAAMREVFRLLPAFQDGAFHLEMFYSETELYFCEIASRPGGIGIVAAIEAAYGINLYQASYAAQCGAAPAPPAIRLAETSWLLVPHGVPLSVDQAYIRTLPWIVECFVDDAGERSQSSHCADGQFKAVLRGDTLSQVAERREALLAAIGYSHQTERMTHEYSYQ
ncbi:ATP-grasp domain-containing protein [Luteibacter aegosomaticola]|uniref:ATP-grasp domain-containing protein n=1 Tax=Luteibacter aegosomaticola TaxID=2911538 RepID=UPI001FFA3343|nr:ATP-grasp domain-containing protein [Luteibacter aegosomaticola]UPG89728.1 ATP-grasp domain-containing protein [Luteibacter aegosomaticola]